MMGVRNLNKVKKQVIVRHVRILIDFNRRYDHVTSRDGRKLAAMLHPDDSPGNPGWQLRVIDLASWTDYVVDLDIGRMARGLTFGPDGRALYWAGSPWAVLAHNATDDYELYRYDLASRELTTVVRFPDTFVPTEMRVMDTGRHLAAYWPSVQDIFLSGVPPNVVVVDVETGRITAKLQLDGIKAGQIQTETSQKDAPCCHIYTPG